MQAVQLAVLGTLLACGVEAKPPPSDITKPFEGVYDIDAKGWQKATRNGKYWFVEFYAPWCQWCKKVAPEMVALGESVGTNHPKVRIGKVNAEDDDIQEIADHYKVKGYPTFIILKPDGTWARHKGKRTVEGFMAFIKEQTGIALTRQTRSDELLTGGTGVVQTLLPETADTLIMNPKLNVLVKFYAPWCGHCKSMADDFKAFALDIKKEKDVAAAEIDASTHRVLADKWQVGSFPKLLWFTKKNKKGVEFKGARTRDAFVAFVMRNKE
eukprot:TRINITY_DN10964_c0_g1_i1.p1 TRINITY_DN10964_c0_g1~~TRINITY_DN10964_c0_g1_i1.p1  ORF type:complete len:269 (+),score=117.50 TRINITY_DN10964_c0_g1_i1:61-867(+)